MTLYITLQDNDRVTWELCDNQTLRCRCYGACLWEDLPNVERELKAMFGFFGTIVI